MSAFPTQIPERMKGQVKDMVACAQKRPNINRLQKSLALCNSCYCTWYAVFTLSITPYTPQGSNPSYTVPHLDLGLQMWFYIILSEPPSLVWNEIGLDGQVKDRYGALLFSY